MCNLRGWILKVRHAHLCSIKRLQYLLQLHYFISVIENALLQSFIVIVVLIIVCVELIRELLCHLCMLI